jgi:transcriptional regulator with XRE-family HTH domain
MAFGTELRRKREAAGLSLAELGKLIHYSKGYLSSVENSTKSPSPDLARLCDAAVDAGGTLLALASPVRTSEISTDGPVPGELPDDAIDDTDRAVLAAAAREEITVDNCRALFNQLVGMGELVSSRVVLPTVIAQARTVWSLALAAPVATRAALTTLAALNSTYAGWLALEAGNDHAAQWWSHTAVSLARLVDDANLVAYTLTRQAQVAVFRDEPDRVFTLVGPVVDDTRVSTRFRGIAAHRMAQGHALMGDYDECRRALDHAVRLPPETVGSPTFDGAVLPPMANGGSHVEGVITGWCLHDLGRPQAAVDLLDRELGQIDVTHRRAAARFGARRILAYVAAGEVDHACTLTHELLAIAAVIDSASVRRELRRLARALARWHNHPSVRELNPLLVAAIRSP